MGPACCGNAPGRQVPERMGGPLRKSGIWRALAPATREASLPFPVKDVKRSARPGPLRRRRQSSKGRLPMTAWFARIERFLRAEDGPTAVEYAVMLALIIVVCIAAIST